MDKDIKKLERIAFILIASFLIALVPTWILYEVLDSSGLLEGVKSGMTIKIGGAAAFYLVFVFKFYPWLLRFWTQSKEEKTTSTSDTPDNETNNPPDMNNSKIKDLLIKGDIIEAFQEIETIEMTDSQKIKYSSLKAQRQNQANNYTENQWKEQMVLFIVDL